MEAITIEQSTGLIIKPTAGLRWVAREAVFNPITTCYGIIPTSRPDNFPDCFVLQQYWAFSNGGGEWRDIEIEWHPELSKSK